MATTPLDELNPLPARSIEEANACSRGNPLPGERPSRAGVKSASGTGGWPRRLPRPVICDRSAPSLVSAATSLHQEKQ